MSDSVDPSAPRVAMAKAFQRGRKKFSDNFGNEKDTDQSSEEEDVCINANEESSVNNIDSSASETLELSLVNSMEKIKISDNSKIVSNHSQHDFENFESADLENVPTLQTKEILENSCEEEQLIINLNEFQKNVTSQTFELSQQNAYYSSRQNPNVYWKQESNSCQNLDEKAEEPDETFEEPKFTDVKRETRSHRRKHRCRTSCRHSQPYYVLSDYVCDDDRALYLPECSHYNHCYCQHYRLCCCRNYCCCSRCCYGWYERCSKSSKHKSSRHLSHHRSSESPKPGSSRRGMDVCSCDSGIITNFRYENDNYNAEEDAEEECASLLHKDSLTILQEKYAGSSRSKRRDTHQNDSAQDYRLVKGRKHGRRHSDRCGNCY